MANFSLTVGADSVVGGAADDTVFGTASTLNAGDSLTGGAGTDVLVLVGSGTYRIDQLATFTGFERIKLDNATNASAQLTLGNQPIEVDATGFLSLSVTPSNWNGSNIINGDISRPVFMNFFNDNGVFPTLPVAYDLTSNTFSHVTIGNVGDKVTLLIKNAVTAGVQSISGLGPNAKLTTAASTLDLSHTTVLQLPVTSTNALGTAFTVGDLGTAFQIAGGTGQDTIIASGFTFSADQRNTIFATASVETIVDQTGTYTIDISDFAPTITSNGGGNTAALSIAENAFAVTTVTATDPDSGQTLAYSITGGVDAGKFTISSSGALSFVTAPNFELPTDAGGNNVYDVIVQASDGHGGIDTQAIAVSVTDKIEPPDMVGQLLLGVNLAGGEFGTPDHVPGIFGTDYIYPSHTEIDYYAAKGMSVIRLPFLWERIQHSENGPLDGAELARVDDVVSYATGKGLKIEIEPHNYGYGFGALIGSAQTPNAAFADLWGKLAFHYQSNPSVIFGLMNEPHDQSASVWLGSANAAIAAIRAAGASQEILVPGSYYDGAWTWTTSDNATVIGTGVQDPSHNFAFEVHQYLDADGSGKHAGVVSADIGVERLTAITQWAEATSHRLFLGEVGVATDQTSLTALDRMLSYMQQHTDVWQGVTYWAGGPWWGDYMFSIEPQNGIDKPQMGVLLQHLTSPPTTVIETNGSTQLTEVGDHFFLYDGSGSGPSLRFTGMDVVAGQFGTWAPIGAEQTANGYEVAWQNGSADQYIVWNTDSSGNYHSSITGVVSGSDYALQSLETGFHQDLNHDGYWLL
jgi:endoglucanase